MLMNEWIQPGGTAKTRSRRTKQLHWDKIRMKNTDGTVWSRESAELGDGFNREELENLFQVVFCIFVVFYVLVGLCWVERTSQHDCPTVAS